ncbi:MAG TPA: DUF2332 domain-containing protein [Gemmatimonadota bacterium]|nr:DUF2332 domain-containing protein [Gemmatimonadota bacterium]
MKVEDRRTVENIRERFIHFVDETRRTSPLYAALSASIAEDEELLDLMREAPPTQRRANLLFAAVHYLLLKGKRHALRDYYASLTEEALLPGEGAAEAFRDFCLSEKATLRTIIGARHTQTNEVRRTGAFLPVFQKLTENSPVALVEVGASAGLNLLVDRYAYRYGDGQLLGHQESPVRIQCQVKGAIPTAKSDSPAVAFRIGLDSSPLDVCDEEDALWLKACVWPEHQERRALLEAAIGIARQHPPTLLRGDAVDDLEGVIDAVPGGLPVCVFHSAMLTYLPKEGRKDFASELDRLAGKREMYWLSLEGTGVRPIEDERLDACFNIENDDAVNAGELILGSWSYGVREDRRLAVVDMHGRWIDWVSEEEELDCPA